MLTFLQVYHALMQAFAVKKDIDNLELIFSVCYLYAITSSAN